MLRCVGILPPPCCSPSLRITQDVKNARRKIDAADWKRHPNDAVSVYLWAKQNLADDGQCVFYQPQDVQKKQVGKGRPANSLGPFRPGNSLHPRLAEWPVWPADCSNHAIIDHVSLSTHNPPCVCRTQPFVLIFTTSRMSKAIVINLNACWQVDDTHGMFCAERSVAASPADCTDKHRHTVSPQSCFFI